jgi:hypothetical protein
MNGRKVLSGLYGLAVVIFGIWLDSRGLKLASQLVVMTAMALLGPFGLALVAKGFWKTWFWIALVCCTLFHIALLWSFRTSMPFPTLGIAILLGIVECFALAFASAKVLDVYG